MSIFRKTHTVGFYRDTKSKWRWHVTHRNGHIVADSGESYSNLSDVQASFRSFARAMRWGRYALTVDREAHGVNE